MRRIGWTAIAAMALFGLAQTRANAQRYLTEIVASTDLNLSRVKVFNVTGPFEAPIGGAPGKALVATETADFQAFPHGVGGVRVALGDINGDGFLDVVAGAGERGRSRVKVIDGTKTDQVDEHGLILPSALLADFHAFTRSFRKGIFVAAGDVNGDGKDDVIVTPDAGYQPVVRVFDAARLTPGVHNQRGALLSEFYAFDHKFRGGVSVAAGDLNKDGLDDIVVGARSDSEALVLGYDATDLPIVSHDHVLSAFAGPKKIGIIYVTHEFTAYDTSFTGGVLVAVADNKDGGPAPAGVSTGPTGTPIVTGPSTPGDGEVRAFDSDAAVKALNAYLSRRIFGDSFVGGVRVAAGDLDGDGNIEVIGAPSPNTGISSIEIAESDGAGSLVPIASLVPFGEGYQGGMFVAAKRIDYEDSGE